MEDTINLDELDKDDLCNLFDLDENECSSVELINIKYDLLLKNNSNNNKIQHFLTNAKTKLLELIEDEEEFPETNLNENEEKYIQTSTNSYPVTIKKDILNPNYKNSTFRIISIDSQYRNTLFPYDVSDANSTSSNTHFTMNLTEPLNNVISMKLYSLQIPYSWYVFDSNLGNNFFYIKDSLDVYTKIEIQSGNYDISGLIDEVNNQLTINSYDASLNLTYSSINGKASFNYDNTTDISLIFYDGNGVYNTNTPFSKGAQLNYNLGWHLGFRQNLVNNISYIDITTPGISCEAIIDVIGTKYLFLSVDDNNHNHLNRGIVNIDFTETRADMPSSFSYDLNLTNDGTNKVIADVSEPRRVSKATLTSINAIQQNKNISRNRLFSPTNSDILAIIPINKNNLDFNNLITELGSTLQTNKRSYFGPVHIKRLKIKLMNDKGYTVNLNGLDWSFSLITEHLYQY